MAHPSALRALKAAHLHPSQDEALQLEQEPPLLGVNFSPDLTPNTLNSLSSLDFPHSGQVTFSLPRTSQSQYEAGQHIARGRLDLLKPGDLVFFGTDGDADAVHHVGMYVGDGNYVHAPYTGAVVRVDSLTARIAAKADYVGASRF